MKKELGKISNVKYGYGGYQDAQFGWWFSFSMSGGCVGTGKGFWTGKPSSGSQWNEADQIRIHGETTMELIEIMRKAKVSEVHELTGVPVELTFDGMKLESWRILEEVL